MSHSLRPFHACLMRIINYTTAKILFSTRTILSIQKIEIILLLKFICIKNTTNASTSQQKYTVRCITARLPNRTKHTNLNLLAADI